MKSLCLSNNNDNKYNYQYLQKLKVYRVCEKEIFEWFFVFNAYRIHKNEFK